MEKKPDKDQQLIIDILKADIPTPTLAAMRHKSAVMLLRLYKYNMARDDELADGLAKFMMDDHISEWDPPKFGGLYGDAFFKAKAKAAIEYARR